MTPADRRLRDQWDAIDFDSVGLWRHLLRYSYRYATVGLLLDLLAEVWRHEHKPDAVDHETVLNDGHTMAAGNDPGHAAFRGSAGGDPETRCRGSVTGC